MSNRDPTANSNLDNDLCIAQFQMNFVFDYIFGKKNDSVDAAPAPTVPEANEPEAPAAPAPTVPEANEREAPAAPALTDLQANEAPATVVPAIAPAHQQAEQPEVLATGGRGGGGRAHPPAGGKK